MGFEEYLCIHRRWVELFAGIWMFQLTLALSQDLPHDTIGLPVLQGFGGTYGSTGSTKRQCEDITIPLCQKLSYNMTVFPNLLNQNQEDAGMEAQQFFPLIKIGCSTDFIFFVCSLYAPPCTVVEIPIPPCKSLCQNAKNGCEPLMIRHGFIWPTKFNCDLFPEDDSNVMCIGRYANRTELATTATYPSAATTLIETDIGLSYVQKKRRFQLLRM
ncbi:frizzled-7-like [Anneissia japonica]|uniref:frizzled-7-like n=1 Tax=Anneissia japonica TaxID=1529436 RepID=UPI00142578EB|nr:frizzled-7-like [Anneissia japonica]